MKKLIIASLASTLIIASMTQMATAAERTTKHHHAATMNEQVRNSNASIAPFYGPVQDDRFRDEAMSPPAGH
jgi:hypothetical protein